MKQKRNYYVEVELGAQIDLIAATSTLKKGEVVEEALWAGLPWVAKKFCPKASVISAFRRRPRRVV
jgi:hypothetical protein